jgi:hypothetical protein
MTLKEFRAKFGGAGVNDDDRLLRYFAGEDAVLAMRGAGALKRQTGASLPLIKLIEQLAQRKQAARIQITHNGLRLRAERHSPAPR